MGISSGRVEQEETATTISVLKIQLESAWSTLQPSFLQAFVDGMPERVKTCIDWMVIIYLNE